jgi:hypothetical protein
LSDALGQPVGAAFAEKYRYRTAVHCQLVICSKMEELAIVGDVKEKDVLIIDDLISMTAPAPSNCKWPLLKTRRLAEEGHLGFEHHFRNGCRRY